ncbi:sulfatase-like hydrolase/transferase [Kitasatospora purpeofusca]|uniref:sulfatase-like hydrolase/transferase n=1 Tax=Kitasatospora purpeofusca TaxID=67352 RepID=UPI0035E0286F
MVLTGQQTADAMGAAGNPYLATPHMDTLAASGTRYRRAYCGQPLCAPSRTGLLTGRLPSTTGAARATGAAADGAVSGTAAGPGVRRGRLRLRVHRLVAAARAGGTRRPRLPPPPPDRR